MDLWIDNRFYKVRGSTNYTIYQYCAKQGINLPCFCYHEKLTIAGNCRICLVEANNALVVSCATLILDNMKIFTKTKRINKAREAVLEFLLNNHPLECPICDQGGECDLQDILFNYGSDRGRFYETNKRAVNDLHCAGPFIKTVMTRCIQCTRCVRFANEISGIYDFGVIGRGLKMEIGTYILNFINDELLGNVIDLCPVGALISMPASFSVRN
jgi:NADH dehydrogenase (ubiquinone) Fe-S protein 1